jgi:anti-sigma factor RsiW
VRPWRSIVSCDEVRQQLPDYVLGTLPETELAAIRRHLRGCAGCRSEASDLDEGVALFASAAHVAEPPPELQAQVMSVLAEEWNETQGEVRGRLRPRLRWPAIATAAAVVAGILVWAVIAQIMAGSYRDDALAYRQVLDTLGGSEIRVAALEPAP